MASALYILALATLVVLVNADTDYCSIETCEPGTHTLCAYPDLDEDNCGEVESTDLTDDEIQDILDTHNKWRAYVGSGQEKRGNPGPQPAATNLGPLKWDNELATIAQAWANQCRIREHDKCENVERFIVNQNLNFIRSTEGYVNTWPDVMQAWYDEVKLLNRSEVDALTYNSPKSLHYVQLMWADTKFVGCGGTRFHRPGDAMKTMSLVCNYGPGGNYATLPIYKTN